MGLIDEMDNITKNFGNSFYDLQKELAVGSSIGSTSGNPYYVQDSSVNLSLGNIYNFMRTETLAHYKLVDSRFNVTNKLIGELLSVTQEVWDSQGNFNPSDVISEAQNSLNSEIKSFSDDYMKNIKENNDKVIKVLTSLKDKNSSKNNSDDLKEELKNVPKNSNWKSTLSSGVKAGVSYLGTTLVAEMQRLGSKFSQLNSARYDNMSDLMKQYDLTPDQAQDIATKEMTHQGTRDYYQWTKETIFKDQQDAEDWQRTYQRDQEDYARQRRIEETKWQRSFHRSEEDWQRGIRRKREDEMRAWTQDAHKASVETFKIPSLVNAAQDTIYQMERRMPGLNLQATEFFKTMTAVFDQTGEMGKETFEEISKLSRNLMVDPNTLLQVSDTYSRYIKLMTKGGKDFQKQMTNVLKVTAKLEDQFVDADGVFGEVMDIAVTPLYEMTDEQITRLQLQARELGMSAVELQQSAQTDIAGTVELLTNADKKYMDRMNIDIKNGISQGEFALMRQFGITGDKITDFISRAEVDTNKAQSKIDADTGTDYGIINRQIELENELYEHRRSREDELYNHRRSLEDANYEQILNLEQKRYDRSRELENRSWRRFQEAQLKEWETWNDWWGGYLTKWDKFELKLETWLLNNKWLKKIDDFLMTITGGKIDFGSVLKTGAVVTGGKVLWNAGKKVFSNGAIGGTEAAIAEGATGGGASSGLATLGSALTKAGGAASIGYGAYNGYKNISTLSDSSNSSNRKTSAGIQLAGDAALVGGGILALTTGPIGLAIAGLGAAVVGTTKYFEEINDASKLLVPVLEKYRKEFESNLESNNQQYTSINNELHDYNLQVEQTRKSLQNQGLDTDEVNAKLESMGYRISEETMTKLQDLNSQLKTGSIDQTTYNTAVRQLASEDQSSGALDILTGKLVGEDGTITATSDLNTALDILAGSGGDNNESLLDSYSRVLKELTEATEKARDAAFDFAEAAAQDKRDDQARETGKHLAESMSTSFQEAINNGDWNKADQIVQDLKKMGVRAKDIEFRQNDGDRGSGNDYEGLTSKEIYNLVAGHGIGVKTTAQRISSGYLDQTNEMVNKYNVNDSTGKRLTISTDEQIADLQKDYAALYNYFHGTGAEVLAGWSSATSSEKDEYRKNVELARKSGGFNTPSDYGAKFGTYISNAIDAGIVKSSLKDDKNRYATLGGKVWLSAYTIPSYAIGSSMIPEDQIAQVHKGERIIPAESNEELGENIATQVDLETIANELSSDSNKSLEESINLLNIQNELNSTNNDRLSIISDKRLTLLDSDLYKINNSISIVQTIMNSFKDIVSDFKKKFEPFWKMVDDASSGEKVDADAFGKGGGFGDLGESQSSIDDPFGSKYPVTSPFGWRTHPISKVKKFHNGTDYGMPAGTPLSAFDNGKVTRNSYQPRGAGNFIEIENPAGYKYVFMHMRDRSPLEVGQSVKVGQTIGHVGSTGASTGPHLHLTVKDPSGQAIDPQQYFQNGYKVSTPYELNELQQLLSKIGIIDTLGMSIEGDHVVVGDLGAIDYSFLKMKEVGEAYKSLDSYGIVERLASDEWAYGPFQYTAKSGQFDNTSQFIRWMKSNGYSDIAATLGNGSVSGYNGALANYWKQAYNKYGTKFKAAQDKFQYDTYTRSMLTKYPFLSKYGAKALGVFAGWSNWLGSGGLDRVLRNVSSSSSLQNVFDARANYVRSLSNYGSWKQGWENRMRDEASYVGVAAHETGLSKVPYDNYPALLHKDERVLNAQEAELWNQYQKEHSGIANYSPDIPEVTVQVDTNGVIDSIEALTEVVKDIYNILKPKSKSQVTVTPKVTNNSIMNYV